MWRVENEQRNKEKKEGKKGGSVKKRENRNVCSIINVSLSWT